MSVERQLAEAYYKLLTSVDCRDDLLVAGLREGLNKFLSNAFMSMYPRVHKYRKTHMISRAALAQVNSASYGNLVYEHMVPKAQYVQQPCENRAMNGDLTVEFIEDLLRRYWRIATITKSENARLPTVMPDDWDGANCLGRYLAAGIELIPNPDYPGDRY